MARYWSKIANYNLPHLYLAPPFGVTRWNFAEIFGFRKLEPLNAYGVVCVNIRLAVWYNTGVSRTDRRMDTRRHHIPR